MRSRHSLALLFFLATSITTRSSPAADVDYLTQIKPLLAEKCYSCHGVLKQESGLRLETRELMARGGDSGPVIAPGDPAGSLLLQRIGADSEYERMPPPEEGSALRPDEIELVRRWIKQGAAAPAEAPPQAPSQHWAFQAVVRPDIPPVADASAADSPAAEGSNPIDALLAAKRAKKGLRVQPKAERSILIRRIYLDLIGLPPTIEQLNDQRPWGEIVDELLASPHHGERWARHWMDIWRYSDWYGLGAQLRNSQKHLWHWRDWIVNSLNDDKSYDRMIQEMLAGDELAPDDPAVVAGTGFLARNYYLFNRTTWLDSTIEHTGKAFLGLTLNCAKCHDHKYDPLTQLDYYRFRAIFEPHQVRLDPIPGVTDFEKDGLPRVFDDHVNLETYLHVRGDPKNPDKDRKISAAVPEILAGFAPQVEPVSLPPAAYAPGVRDYVQRDRVAEAEAKVGEAEKQLQSAKQKLARMTTSQPGNPSDSSGQGSSFEFSDDFDEPDPSVWKIIGDGWQYRDGALHQTVATRESAMVRLLRPMPRDFDVTCRFTTTGGTTYKSVTLRFDQSEESGYANYVYTSAHEPGPKVQVAFQRGGKSSYPPQGRRGHKIVVGKPYELRFAVRDNLVNVWLDGEFMVAYRFPDRRDGFLSLSGFDATVAFDSIAIRSLEGDLELREAGNEVIATASDAESAVRLAEARLRAATAKLRSVEATVAADDARYLGGSVETTERLALSAAIRQAEARKASAEYRMLADAADDKKRKAAKQQLDSAIKQLEAIDEGDAEVAYQSIRGAKKALESPAHKEADYPPTYSPTSTGRRLALARWISSRENPLTARVAVNHVWARHFGTPLVESVFDFGLRAKRPLHSELLDLLAWEFMDSGWSLQHLHRLIVTSETYRLTSSTRRCDAATVSKDPSNEYYWRMNSRRMEAQLVRDSLLLLAGELDARVGGPSIDPSPEARRRSLYFKHSRDQQDKFLSMFDDADILQCYRRSESIVPQQALALSNSSLSFSMADAIERRLSGALQRSGRQAFIERVFYSLLGRQPSDAETRECQRFFDDASVLAAKDPTQPGRQDDDRRIRVRLVQSILNHNDFITIR